MQDETLEYTANVAGEDYDEAFAFLERDARRYNKAFSEEAEAKHI